MSYKDESRGIITGLGMLFLPVAAVISNDWGVPGQEFLQTIRFTLCICFVIFPTVLLFLGARWRALILLVLILGSAGQGLWVVYSQLTFRYPLERRSEIGSLSIAVLHLSPDDSGETRTMDLGQLAAADLVVVTQDPLRTNAFDKLQVAFPYRVGCGEAVVCDVDLLSRIPLIHKKSSDHPADPSTHVVIGRVLVNDEVIAVAGINLAKSHFDSEAWGELMSVLDLIQSVHEPTILAGVFNAAPWSSRVSKFIRWGEFVPGPQPDLLGTNGTLYENVLTNGNLLTTRLTLLPGISRVILAQVGVLADN